MDDINLSVSTLFAGGRLCLDFVNTSCHRRGVDLELIGSGDELRKWLRQAESVLGRSLCPDDSVWEAGYGESVLPRALELRAALHDLVLSVIDGTPTPISALETVNALLRENPTYAQIGGGNDEGFRSSVRVARPEDTWLVAIAQDAVDLLCEGDLSLIRQCECPTCIRVFYDMTKNHKRRWCVEKCGSKPKAAAYYRRKVARARQAQSANTDAASENL